MKTTVSLLLLTFVCLTVAFAQTPAKPAQPTTPPTISQILDRSLGYPESEVVPAADAMPDDKFEFAPAASMGDFKGVRTFGEQVKHLAGANYMLGAAILGEKPPAEMGGEEGPAKLTSKADIVKYLNDSFAYLHKAMNSVTAENILEELQSPFGSRKTTRLALVTIALSHPFDHYGQMVEYLRMNNIIPPASRH